MSNTDERLFILLGAGSSQAAGMPSTDDITKVVISGDNYKLHSKQRYYRSQDFYEDPINTELRNLANTCIRYAKGQIDSHFAKHQLGANYEDIYQYLLQIKGFVAGSTIDPAAAQSASEFLIKFNSYLFSDSTAPKRHNPFDILTSSLDFIQDVVVGELLFAYQQINTNGLFPLIKICKNDRFSRIDVITLCHDTLLEEVLKAHDISHRDGFEIANGSIRFWQPDELHNEDSKRIIQFLAFHGSLNWWWLKEINNERRQMLAKLNSASSEPIISHSNGSQWERQPVRPFILIGTGSKFRSYSQSHFLEMNYYAHRHLQKTNKLLIVGYGFRDWGVNDRIRDYMFRNNKSRMTIIDNDTERISHALKLAFGSDNVKQWQSGNRLTIIKKRLENVDDNDIDKILNG